MYLTRFEINPARRGAQRLLGSPQALHAAVMRGFPSSATVNGSRVLWRIDRVAPHTWLYVVSPAQPDFEHLVEQAGWPTINTTESRPYAPVLDRLEKGGRWAFRLRANPTRSSRIGNRERSQRLGHVTVSQQLGWLLERIEAWGISLPTNDHGPTVVVSERETWRFKRKERQVTLATATFEGELVVEEPERLRAALLAGIGPAKAYGCGLMTLAPSRRAP